MVMQFVAAFGYMFYYAFSSELRGKSSVSLQEAIVKGVEQNTSTIIIIAVILSLIIYTIMLAIRHKTLLDVCSFKLISIKELSVIILAGAGLSMIIDSILTFVPVDKWFPSHQEVVNSITSGSNFTLTVLAVGVVVPIFEEILLRGLVFNELRKNLNLTLAIILQGIIFGIYHMNMLQGIYASILGVFLGLAYVWTKSIYAPIVIHMFFNSSSLLLSKLQPNVSIFLYLTIGIIFFWVGIKLLYKLTHIQPKVIT